jgi:sirohydrochlorin ferrochelatase
MELAQPDVPTAIERLVREGATEIHLHLQFLSRGYHVRETIPTLLETARTRHAHVRFHLSDPIGEDPRLIDIVVERIDRLER